MTKTYDFRRGNAENKSQLPQILVEQTPEIFLTRDTVFLNKSAILGKQTIFLSDNTILKIYMQLFIHKLHHFD